ncbi:MAG: biotin--[acetyl-CoA-carboxylase] ligase [Deltaproteobacteria bacterium]|nr:biotin--[acetyl-CoA-carboxylase] ligase [Deltaproteobacteria bacterium]
MNIDEVILQYLYDNVGDFVPSVDICKKVNVSRIAIWNRIKNLRKLGFRIESKKGIGYKLTEKGKNILIPFEIKRRLFTEFIGKRIEYYKLTSSTMDEAGSLIKTGCPQGTVVIAEEQQRGRGRRGKEWFSPLGNNIYLSVVLFPQHLSMECGILIMFIGSIAIIETLSDYGIEAKIKWPNDCMLGGKKIGGVLMETATEGEFIKSVILGIGINVNQEDFPSSLKDVGISAMTKIKDKIDRADMIASLLYYLEKLYLLLEKGGKEKILDLWREYSDTIGRRIAVDAGDNIIKGKAKNVDECGFLLVEANRVLRKITCRESLRYL